MATITANISASDTTIPVSAELDNGFYTIDSENLYVHGSSRGAQGRAFDRLFLSVDRGIGGSTAATHTSGATLTRYYPDAATAAAGGVTNPLLEPFAVTADAPDVLVITGSPSADFADLFQFKEGGGNTILYGSTDGGGNWTFREDASGFEFRRATGDLAGDILSVNEYIVRVDGATVAFPLRPILLNVVRETGEIGFFGSATSPKANLPAVPDAADLASVLVAFGLASQASAALSGTAGDGMLESQVVTGGQVLEITLTGAQWIDPGAQFNAQRQAIIDGLTSAQAEAGGWNATVKPAITVAAVVRSSGTLVTITLPAVGGYTVTSDETITVTIPEAVIEGVMVPLVATPTIVVTANS